MATARYDRIGAGYARLRREDPRIAASVHAALGAARTVVNVGAGAGSDEPGDTPDWMLAAFWAHPERVLEPAARAATSGFARMPRAVVRRVVAELRRDLDSGAWDARHGALRELDAHDAGLRLIVATP